MPREWAQTDTVAKTRVKTCGAVDKPKQRTELVGDAIRYETEPFSGGSVDGYLEVGVLEVDGSKEVAPSHRKKDRGGGLHLEGSLLYELVERGEVDHGSPASGRLLHQEEAAVEAGTLIGYSLQGPLCHHGLDLLTQGESFWGARGYVGNGTGEPARGGSWCWNGIR